MGLRNGWKWQPDHSRLAVQVAGEDVAYFNRNMAYIPVGHTYYVDSRSWAGDGDDSNAGISPEEPFATIGHAVSVCEAGKNDYIFVIDGYDNDEATVTMGTSAVHVIGLGAPTHAGPWVWLKEAGTGATAVFTLTGGDCVNFEIAGFALAGSSSIPCITVAGAGNCYGLIHDVCFAGTTDTAFLAQDGFLVPSGTDAVGLTIEDCVFGDQLSRDGVRISGGMTRGMIRRCHFEGNGVVSINHTEASAVASMPSVLNCTFQRAHGAAEGWAITIQNASGGLIDGNHASADFTTADANPFLDHSDKSQWGLNYNVITATAPATT